VYQCQSWTLRNCIRGLYSHARSASCYRVVFDRGDSCPPEGQEYDGQGVGMRILVAIATVFCAAAVFFSQSRSFTGEIVDNMHAPEKSDCAVVCAEQRVVQEG
jgi:hypothetical protein